jgi:hypothetical protein
MGRLKQDVIIVDSYEPNYLGECGNCGTSPTVMAVRKNQIVVDFGLCGPCCFGSAKAIDPQWWNSSDD